MSIRPSWGTLGSLLVVTCLVQAWTIHRAVVPAQDSIRYLTVAQGIARDGLAAAVRTQPEQPLFPMLVWLTHALLGQAGHDGPGGWALSVQLAAAAPLVLSVAPVYLLFCRLHGRRAATLGALLFCVLGGFARLGADGLSDSTHLLLFCLALWTAAEYFAPPADQRRSAAWLLACGVLTGLALLARAEAVVLPVAMLASLAAFQCYWKWRQPWRAAMRAAGAMMFGLALPLVPYLAASQAGNLDAIAARVLGRQGALESLPLNDLSPAANDAGPEPKWHTPGVGQLVFGRKDFSASSRFRGYLPAAVKLAKELAQTLHYAIGALALAGLWSARRRLNTPLDRFMQLLCGTLLIAAIYMAAGGGYLSTRHVLLLVVLGLGWAGVGAVAVGDWLATLTRSVSEEDQHAQKPDVAQPPSAVLRRRSRPGGTSRGRLVHMPILNRKPGQAILSWSVAALALATCTGDLLRPLHASRAAHRDAADWLNANATAAAAVLDSRGWTALYTGRKTYRYEAAQAAFRDPSLAYVVVEQAELDANSRRSETLRLLVAQAGEPAARFAPEGAEKHGVTVWRWYPERFAQWRVDADAR
ncbi:MAG TPA: glycosyltransferase family 39 protein [Pirellulales bacterium]|nr:glycosyltransferase family 39 protein [Pirellulales bacterium]